MPESTETPISPPKPKANLELSLSHKNSTDFINSGTLFDQRLVSSYFTSNLSTTMFTAKLTGNPSETLAVSSGLLTNWQEGKPYEQATRERSLTTVTGSKNFSLTKKMLLQTTMTGVYVPNDGKGPAVSYANPEVKLVTHTDYVGMGAVLGQNVAKQQFYLTAGNQNLRANWGVYKADGAEQVLGARGMVSYDWKLGGTKKLQLFTSAETGEHGEQRIGAIYETKLASVGLRANAIFNSRTAHAIENLNAAADILFSLNSKNKHALNGVIGVFAGYAGEFKTSANPDPSLNLVYGAHVKLNLFNTKNHTSLN